MIQQIITQAMKEGLARMYADEGCRAYFQMEIVHQNQNAMTSLDKGDTVLANRYANRVKAFQDIMERGKEFFTHFEKIRVESEKLKVKE